MRMEVLKQDKTSEQNKGRKAMGALCLECKFVFVPCLYRNSTWAYICACFGQSLQNRKQTVWDLDYELLSLFMIIDFFFLRVIQVI